MKKILFALPVIALSFLSAQPSFADLQITVDNVIYDVTTVSGSLPGLYNLLSAQPEWGSAALATDIAQAVGFQFGNLPINAALASAITAGPLFVYYLDPNLTGMVAAMFQQDFPNTPPLVGRGSTSQLPLDATYGIILSATPVPEPSTWISGMLALLPIGYQCLRRVIRSQPRC